MIKRKIELCMTLLLLLGMIAASMKLSRLVTNGELQEKTETEKIVIVDAGHGGEDPGKVGVNDALEKDLNLQIAKKLKACLEEKGIQTVMTREEDKAEETKMADMKKRVSFINEVKPAIVVSIHQNSYSDASIKGAQVFYYTDSEESKGAAAIMQEELKKLDSENTREIKANKTFYLLKKTEVPTIIVECGFLSNPGEAEKLVTESYQEELASTICNGILKWIEINFDKRS